MHFNLEVFTKSWLLKTLEMRYDKGESRLMIDNVEPFSFTKMHSLGNDFVLIENPNQSFSEQDIRAIANRNYGIGCDQVMIIEGSAAPYALAIWNQDGTRALACGNGTRCVVAYLAEKMKTPFIELQGPVGALTGWVKTQAEVSVNQGRARVLPVDLPFLEEQAKAMAYVEIGNPHIVVQVLKIPVEFSEIAERVSAQYSQGVNVSFIEVHPSFDVKAAIWERGAGATRACGSAACAIGAMLFEYHPILSEITVKMPGGNIQVGKTDEGDIFHTASACHVFDGKWRKIDA